MLETECKRCCAGLCCLWPDGKGEERGDKERETSKDLQVLSCKTIHLKNTGELNGNMFF